jgi:hypothetical protein
MMSASTACFGRCQIFNARTFESISFSISRTRGATTIFDHPYGINLDLEPPAAQPARQEARRFQCLNRRLELVACRDRKIQRLRRFDIDQQLELGRLLDG